MDFRAGVKKAASTIAYPFLYLFGLGLGYGFLLWEKRLLDDRIRQRKDSKTSYWLAGTEDDPWPSR